MKFLSLIFLICFLCFAPSLLLRAQEIKINGVVFEKGTKLRIALAEINNKRSGYGVGSNDLGMFTIIARVGDTLQVIKRGFSDLELVVSSNRDLLLYLDRGNYLNEVVITGQSKRKALEDIKKDFKDKGTFYEGKPPLALLLPFGGSPLTFFYELFGRTPRNARRFSKYYQTEVQQMHIDEFFNKALINKYTGLTGKELENFMMNYRPTYERSKNWVLYDGIKWIKDSYKKYSDTLSVPIK